MVTTRQKPVVHKDNEMSRTLKKIIQSQGKRAKGTGTTTQTDNNYQSGSNYIPTNNHFKCK